MSLSGCKRKEEIQHVEASYFETPRLSGFNSVVFMFFVAVPLRMVFPKRGPFFVQGH